MAKGMKISAGQAESYYYSKDSVYGKDGENSNLQWLGTGAEALGLSGKFEGLQDMEKFTNLLNGRDPSSGEQLVGKPSGPQAHGLNACTDIPLTVPKTFAVAAMEDPRIREAISRVYKEVAQNAEAYVYGRQTKDGVTEQVKSQMIAVLAEHGTSRAGDTHPHGHLVIINCVQRPDGTNSTLENYELMKAQAAISQDVYNGIAKEAVALGYVVETDKKGNYVVPELKGIDKETCDLFSKRHMEIRNADGLRADLRDRMPNASDIKIDNLAQLMTKAAKDPSRTEADIVASHRSQATEMLGKNLPAMVAVASQLGNTVERGEPKTAADYIHYSLADNIERESVLKKEIVINDAIKLGCGDITRKEIEKAFGDSVAKGEIKQLAKDTNAYSTQEMIKAEREIAVTAVKEMTQFSPLKTKEEATAEIAKFEQSKIAEGKEGFAVTSGQRQAIELTLTSQARLSLIQGDAGAGKSAAFECINNALREMPNLQIIGLGFQGKAAQELQRSSGIVSQTLHSFLGQESKGDDGSRKLFVVDEASMVSSSQFHALLERAKAEQGQVVMIGDGKQLSSIGAGTLFTKLMEYKLTKPSAMNEVKRQKFYDQESKELRPGRDDVSKAVNAWAVEIAQNLKVGDFTGAFRKIDGAGMITSISDRNERIKYTAEKFVSYGSQEQAIVLVATNKDRHDTTTAIREMQKASGQIGVKDYKFTVRDPIATSGIARRLGSSYSADNYITLGKDIKISGEVPLAAGTVLKISSTNSSTNQLTFDMNGKDNELKFVVKDINALRTLQAEGRESFIDLKQHGSSLQQFTKNETSYSLNEAIMITKNNNTLAGRTNGEKNGCRVFLQSIDEKTGLATVRGEGGKIIQNYKLEDSYSTNGQVISINKAQGISCQHVISNVAAKEVGGLIHTKSIYVALTRHENTTEIVTDNKDELLKAAEREVDKTSTLDFMPKEEMAGLQARAAESREATREPTELEKIEAQIDAKELAEQKELVQSQAQTNSPTKENDQTQTQTMQPDHEAGKTAVHSADRAADQNLTGSNNEASHVVTDHGKNTETSTHGTGKTADHSERGDRGDDKSGGTDSEHSSSGGDAECSRNKDNGHDTEHDEPEQERDREQEYSR